MSMGNKMPTGGGWLMIVVVGLALIFFGMEMGNIYGN